MLCYVIYHLHSLAVRFSTQGPVSLFLFQVPSLKLLCAYAAIDNSGKLSSLVEFWWRREGGHENNSADPTFGGSMKTTVQIPHLTPFLYRFFQ